MRLAGALRAGLASLAAVPAVAQPAGTPPRLNCAFTKVCDRSGCATSEYVLTLEGVAGDGAPMRLLLPDGSPRSAEALLVGDAMRITTAPDHTGAVWLISLPGAGGGRVALVKIVPGEQRPELIRSGHCAPVMP